MLASFLMGLAGGQRGITPLAAVAVGTAAGRVAPMGGPFRLLSHPLVAAATVVLAIAEMGGDKMKSAPDRIVPIGLATRFATSAIAGAALAAPGRRRLGGLIGAVTAVLASYPGWRARMATMPRYGQTPTGLVEDALVASAAAGIIAMPRRTAPD